MDGYDDLDIVDEVSAFSVLSILFACRLVQWGAEEEVGERGLA